jgi:EpsD family peptidyl-prolyl cis-trans isomerase
MRIEPVAVWRRAAGIGIALALLGGCGGDSKPKAPGQVLAKVNGAEITVHQVNSELARLGAGGAPSEAVTRRVLDSLVDQQLLVEQAVNAKLDRDPQVVQALERTRRQILGEAWLERNASAARPAPEEVKAFYAKNPDLFEKRRVYAFREWSMGAEHLSDALRARLDRAKIPGDVAAILKDMKIPYRETQTARAAEQLPIETLPKIAALGKGDILVLTAGNQANLLQIVDWSEQPVSEQQAGPMIEQYLVNAKKKEIVENKLKELRGSAKITYVSPDPAAAPKPEAKAAGKGGDFVQKGVEGMIRK